MCDFLPVRASQSQRGGRRRRRKGDGDGDGDEDEGGGGGGRLRGTQLRRRRSRGCCWGGAAGSARCCLRRAINAPVARRPHGGCIVHCKLPTTQERFGLDRHGLLFIRLVFLFLLSPIFALFFFFTCTKRLHTCQLRFERQHTQSYHLDFLVSRLLLFLLLLRLVILLLLIVIVVVIIIGHLLLLGRRSAASAAAGTPPRCLPKSPCSWVRQPGCSRSGGRVVELALGDHGLLLLSHRAEAPSPRVSVALHHHPLDLETTPWSQVAMTAVVICAIPRATFPWSSSIRPPR